MKKITTIGVLTSFGATETTINQLRSAGISESEISCIYTDTKGNMKDSQKVDKVEIESAKGAAAGAVVGAIAGLVVANGILPGIGTLFVAGPLVSLIGITGGVATTIAGAATGAVAGGIVGALVELGISKEDAAIYEEKVRIGNYVIIVHSDTPGAKAVLDSNHATEVRERVLPTAKGL